MYSEWKANYSINSDYTHLKSTMNSIKPAVQIGIMSKHSKLLSEQHGCDHWEKDLSRHAGNMPE